MTALVTKLVADARRHVEEVLGPDGWSPMPGRDGVSSVHQVGSHVVKIRSVSPFYAKLLGPALCDVHAALAPSGLAPRLELACYDGDLLATICTKVDGDGEPVAPDAIGRALARAHACLADVPARSTHPWIGYYGEHAEFSYVVPAVADEELRGLAERLLPYASRVQVPTPSHYVHRDLHPDNVLGGPAGPCFVDWEMVHVGPALDDLAMTALMWAAESSELPARTAARVLAGYAAGGGRAYDLDDPELRAALALSGLRQGIGGWFTDEGACSAPYWPYLRKRIRTAVELLCAPAAGADGTVHTRESRIEDGQQLPGSLS